MGDGRWAMERWAMGDGETRRRVMGGGGRVMGRWEMTIVTIGTKLCWSLSGSGRPDVCLGCQSPWD